MLKVNNISFSYSSSPILKQLSFMLEKGEIASLIGSSGSGKTTLFKLLAGILKPDEGSIEIDEGGLPAYMTQQDLLLPWRTVIRNMTLLAELGTRPESSLEQHDEAAALLAEMGLAGYEHYFPDELSGGMRQRVSLARALMQKRPLLLLDEPFASLDVSLREQMYQLLRTIQEKRKTTILLVTHDFRDAATLSNQIFFLDNGEIKNQWKIGDEERADPRAKGMLIEELRSHFIHST